MADTIRIDVVLDSEGAVVQTRQLGQEIQKLPGSAVQASAGMKTFTTEQRAAADMAGTLAHRLGVEIPGGAGNFISAVGGMGGSLMGAFGPAAMAIISIALFELITNFGSIIDKLKDWDGAQARAKISTDNLNIALGEQYKKQGELLRQQELIGKTPLQRAATTAVQKKEQMESLQLDIDTLEKRIKELKAIEAIGAPLKGVPYESLTYEQEKQKKAALDAAAALSALTEIEKVQYNLEGQLALMKGQLRTATVEGTSAEMEFAHTLSDEEAKALKEAIKAEEDAIKKREQFIGVTMSLIAKNAELAAGYEKTMSSLRKEAQAAFEKSSGFVSTVAPQSFQDQVTAGLAANQREALAIIKTYQDQKAAVEQLTKANDDLALSLGKRGASHQEILAIELALLDKEKAKYADNAAAIEEIERRKGLLIQQTNLEIADDAKAQFDKSAQAIENFFDRVFLTAKSFSDVWKQLWTQSVSWVVKQFSHMVASWLAARNQMGGASAGGGGAGGILSGVGALMPGSQGQAYGTAGGAAAMALPAFAGGTGAAGGYDLNQLPGWGGTAASTGSIAGRLPFLSLKNPMIPGAAAIAGMGIAQYGMNQSNPWAAGAGGALAGWGIGTSVATMFPKLLGSLSPYAGWIGAAIAATYYIVKAVQKRNMEKRESAGIYRQYLDEAKLIIDQYEMHKASYESALSGLSTVYERTVSNLGSFGKAGGRTVELVTSYYRGAVDRINNLEKVRAKRTEVMAGLPVPEFASGSAGIIKGLTGGAFPAILHLGEAVLNAKAAASLGDQNIRALNQGQGAGEITVQMIFPGVQDPSGFEAALKKNAGAVIRLVRKAARDNGLPVPV